jgi:hypothetical protein
VKVTTGQPDHLVPILQVDQCLPHLHQPVATVVDLEVQDLLPVADEVAEITNYLINYLLINNLASYR